MTNGLDVGLDEFKKMKALDRDVVGFNNLAYIRQRLDSYQFHKKIQYVWLSVLTAGVLILLGFKKFGGF